MRIVFGTISSLSSLFIFVSSFALFYCYAEGLISSPSESNCFKIYLRALMKGLLPFWLRFAKLTAPSVPDLFVVRMSGLLVPPTL